MELVECYQEYESCQLSVKMKEIFVLSFAFQAAWEFESTNKHKYWAKLFHHFEVNHVW